MDKCKGLSGFIFGHNYHEVITKSAPMSGIEVQGDAKYCAMVIDSYRSQTYHGIYCKRCGKFVNS